MNSGLDVKDKLQIVGELIGRAKSVHKDDIYDAMLGIHDNHVKITIKNLSKVLCCSTRTIHRNMGEELKREKELLNKQL